MAMQKLNVRFSDESKESISNVADLLVMSDSNIARAAMNIGLEVMRDEAIKANLLQDFSSVNKLVETKQ